jgi:hypothetical protein
MAASLFMNGQPVEEGFYRLLFLQQFCQASSSIIDFILVFMPGSRQHTLTKQLGYLTLAKCRSCPADTTCTD